ncbi:putative MFS family arabinose efflux permease [Pusillimonas noertemannii]|uniref:Putative MFS family arabinose efflux permease n=2 Tax=Pusillimonas noertemannii TaxID=305977 RepID=A0A2U1CKA6_9BURK|nr:putative MFS family arabinose efflux permease [Pusillimonas noertemannii]TFL08983.1 MFS transporter [Pusillimonas noertemannii]
MSTTDTIASPPPGQGRSAGAPAATNRPMTSEERRVIFASSLGTVFEWYDFYLYGSLAAIIAAHFFSGVNPTAGFIFALLAFAAGFAVRPFGALVFGRLGDLVGRKYTFLITILIMGLSTFLVGVLPSYSSIGMAAPVILIILRLLQGLALGGEYGGAATYVAEHAPQNRRGFYTSWIQTTATMGLFLSLLLILGIRSALGEEAFLSWGWRVPFLISAVLLIISVWIRMRLNESPAFKKMKEEGTQSEAPIKESFGQWRNLKIVILALLGLTAGQAVVWYTGQFYALFFLTKSLGVEANTANILIALALLLGTPFFVVFGALSDKIGRKPIIMAGCLIAALAYFPVFKAITHFGNPALEHAQATAPVTIVADPATCSFQFNPVGTASFTSSCDILKAFMASNSVNYENVAAPAGTLAVARIGDEEFPAFEGAGMSKADFTARSAQLREALTQSIRAHGYPAKADPTQINYFMVVVLLTFLVILVTMVYGPIAAMLVEMFPTRIRYTSMSLPYHIGNGWFGGFLPPVAFAIVAATGNIYDGLWYPIGIAVMSLVIGTLFVKETRHNDINA